MWPSLWAPIAAALLTAVTSGGLAWLVQGWRADARLQTMHAEYAKQDAERAQAAQALVETNIKRLQDAQTAHAKKEAELRRAAATARAAVDGLRHSTYGIDAKLSAAPEPARIEFASTAAELLGECSTRYSDVAAAADGHAAEVVLLREAWPIGQTVAAHK